MLRISGDVLWVSLMIPFVRSFSFLSVMATIFAGAAALAQDAPQFHLGKGDVLSFSIVGAPEIGREVTIGLDGKVFLPMIGAVPADGLTPAELRQLVDSMIQRSPIRIPNMSGEDVWHGLLPHDIIIDVAEYRPVYVSGTVELPGEVSFRPGLTVRQALARAGGTRLLNETEDLRVVEVMARRDRLSQQIAAVDSRISRLTRDLESLQTPLGDDIRAVDGAETAAAAASSVAEAAQKGTAAARDAVDGAWLEAREDLRASEHSARRARLEKLETRLKVLQDLERVAQETVGIEEENVARAKELAARGVATANLYNDVRQDLLQASSRQLDTSGEVLELQVTIAQTREELDTEQIGDALDLLEDLEKESSQRLTLMDEFRTLDAYLANVGAVSEDDRDMVQQIRLYRADATGNVTGRIVDPDEILLPADVLDVSMEAPAPEQG